MRHQSDAIAAATDGKNDVSPSTQRVLEAGRHLCGEARVVLTSLRGGPPNVARGDLAQDLVDVRGLVKHMLSSSSVVSSAVTKPSEDSTGVVASNKLPSDTDSCGMASNALPEHQSRSTGYGVEEEGDAILVQREDIVCEENKLETLPARIPETKQDVGPFAGPFLAVVMDPRAAGPHTLVALRALHRLLERGSLMHSGLNRNHGFAVELEPLTRGVLSCKFEQTDAGADEAVEMAIADLLAFLINIDRRSIRTETLMDAFNTVFVTRNTFVHSPALCYHFEDVLTAMVRAVFEDLDNLRDPVALLILEFLVNQLLHTPLVGGDDDASRDAQIAHDATRVLCLRLTRCALRYGFYSIDDEQLAEQPTQDESNQTLLQIVQDDLCLSLLMTGQAIWAYQENSNISPGFISLEVLSEICATFSTLWTTVGLRKNLIPQFEAVFTGFYQRALVLLRKRVNPIDSATFHANLVFDAGLEVILESLVDIMCLHDHRLTVAQGNGGSLETIFATYDCNVKRSDVAVGLMIELCRCCGSKVDEEGDTIETTVQSETPSATPTNVAPDSPQESMAANRGAPESSLSDQSTSEIVPVDPTRQVPAHLKELCAEAIMGGMKCLFRDDHPSEQTRAERSERQSIMSAHVDVAPQSLSQLPSLGQVRLLHQLRTIKSKKRLMRKAAHMFNKKSSKGIEFLANSGLIPDPVTPRSVASFLRNGIVVGLDKRAAGSYLGEVGKSPQAGKSPPNWERDWFHKECLETYCSFFRFDRQSLLDGLRMFLAAFRLPGEAQQIDRILQAFSDSCGRSCEESALGTLGLFSDDPKRASDAAYLLSFSIIMLNTDLHNDNIREDRKMSKDDFVKNNTDYGRDITERGKELPRDYLEAIYDSIKEEEIRTEGEGADGSMTVERWKDVLRGSAEDESQTDQIPTSHDAEDLTELVLEHVWMPIMSAIGALWGVARPFDFPATSTPVDTGPSGMLGAQGARLGMDMALDMLVGVRQLGRKDIFRKIFNCVCGYTGLLEFASNAADRTWSFVNSVEAQSALIVALRVARDASEEIGVDGWKRVWSIICELRDLKLLGGGVSQKGRSILRESDPDLLKDDARRDWTIRLIKGGIPGYEKDGTAQASGVTSVFGAVGRALFGSVDESALEDSNQRMQSRPEEVQTVHGKEGHVVWDEIAPSDDEDEAEGRGPDVQRASSAIDVGKLSAGARFENQLIHEDLIIHQQREMPVTGLERVDDSQVKHISPRARVRQRLLQACDYAGVVSESRFIAEEGIGNLIQALVESIPVVPLMGMRAASAGVEAESQPASVGGEAIQYALSPASEGFLEVLIAEIALRNRDRLHMLWHRYLRKHYVSRLDRISQTSAETNEECLRMMNVGIEKCITGLLRISCCAVQRGDTANDILETWNSLPPIDESQEGQPLLGVLDKHIGEGCWRVTRNIDGTSQLSEAGWDGLLSLIRWCSYRGGQLPVVRSSGIGRPVGLAEDDPALQAYRSLHFMLNACEVKELVPPPVVQSIRVLVAVGEHRNCPKLSIAALDLLHVVSNQVDRGIAQERFDDRAWDQFWKCRWRPVVDEIAEVAEKSATSAVRQHSLSMLADSFLEKRGGLIPVQHLCSTLGELCIPLAGRRILALRNSNGHLEEFDELMIELELCIGLIFKPLRHHLKNIVEEGDAVLMSLWKPVLMVLTEILSPSSFNGEMANAEAEGPNSDKIFKATNELAIEHLRNVIMVLIGYGVLSEEPNKANDFTDLTWTFVDKIEVCKPFLGEWKKAASQAS